MCLWSEGSKALGEIARDWLEGNEIPFEDDVTAK